VRLEAYEERVDRAIADRIEAAEKPAEDQQPRPEPAGAPAARTPASAEAMADVDAGSAPGEAESKLDSADLGGQGLEEDIAIDDGGDADMGAVQEEESEEEMGIVHEDVDDEVSAILLAQVGHSSRSYRRELRKGYKHLVSEIYSPPRVTKEIKQGRFRHLAPGFALDLTVIDPEDGQPWDFSRKDKREKARRMQREQRPILLIGPPMCTHFSTWQYLNYSKSRDKAAMQRAYVGACAHMRFVAELCHEQIRSNR